MEGIKIFSLLKTFSSKEFKELGLFLDSPFFNRNKRITTLYEVLKSYHPDFKNPDLIKKQIHSAIYTNRKYDDIKVRRLFSVMYFHIKTFLSYTRFKKANLDSEIFFLEELNDRTLGKIFNYEINETMSVLEKYDLKNEDYNFMMFLIENMRVKFMENNQIIMNGEKYYENEKRCINYLTSFLLITLLKKYFQMLNAKRIYNIKSDDVQIENTIDFLFKNFTQARELPIVNVTHQFLKLFNEDVDIDTVRTLKKISDTNRKYFKYEDYKAFFIELYNYCKRRQDAGSKEFGYLSIVFMKEMLQENIFFEQDGYMLDHTYINLANSAFKVNDMDWAENFIKKYRDKISPDKRDSAYNFAHALYYFLTAKNNHELKCKNYEMAFQHLSKVKIEYYYYYNRVNNLYLILYYEMNDFIHAESIIDTYRHYLRSNKELPENINRRHSNFLNYINKLFHLREDISAEKIERFKEEITNDKLLEYRGWFIEKLDEIERNVRVL